MAWDASVITDDMIGHSRLHDDFVLGAYQRKTITILYETKSEDPGPDDGDEFTIAVPLPDGARPVRFRVGGQ